MPVPALASVHGSFDDAEDDRGAVHSGSRGKHDAERSVAEAADMTELSHGTSGVAAFVGVGRIDAARISPSGQPGGLGGHRQGFHCGWKVGKPGKTQLGNANLTKARITQQQLNQAICVTLRRTALWSPCVTPCQPVASPLSVLRWLLHGLPGDTGLRFPCRRAPGGDRACSASSGVGFLAAQ